MRCQFCGWDNPPGKLTCEKCNQSLSSGETAEAKPAEPSTGNQERPTNRQLDGINPKATLRESSATDQFHNDGIKECPDCGYPLDNGECSACGYSEKESGNTHDKSVNDIRKTMRPSRKGAKAESFRLIPISEDTGMPEGDELSYTGNTVILNRDNTDPTNSTITSQEQACVTCESGKWSIEDKSQYKTTFIQSSEKIELHQGDLILLGNQLYRFEI